MVLNIQKHGKRHTAKASISSSNKKEKLENLIFSIRDPKIADLIVTIST